MQEILFCQKGTLSYYLLVRPVGDPALWAGESYGVIIRDEHGEEDCVPDISVNLERVRQLLTALADGGVTPVTLRDIVEDWL